MASGSAVIGNQESAASRRRSTLEEQLQLKALAVRPLHADLH
ncbi:hypothetical protein ACFSR7_06030 [Cohnella sp. GCM10020058]